MPDNGKKARFFCSSCGAEVPQNARVCKACGKFFTFVQCPQCGYSGESKQFSFGCPSCGYAAKPGEFHNALGKETSGTTDSSSSSRKQKSKKNIFSLGFGSSKNKGGDGTLPVWIYIITLAMLIVVLFGVYSCL